MEFFNRSDLVKWVVNGITKDNYLKSCNIFKDLGFLKKEVNVKLEDNNYWIGDFSFETIEKLKEKLNRIIDSTFNEKQNAAILELEKNMLVGTEFTFRRDDYDFSINDLKQKEENERVKRAIDDIEAWMRCINERAVNGKRKNRRSRFCEDGSVSDEIYSSMNEGDINKLRHEADDKTAPDNKISYSYKVDNLADTSLGDENEKLFWINFALDTDCIELQTMPATKRFFEDNISWLQEDLFATSEKIFNNKLRPDTNPDTGGGGHITVDLATSFGDNAIGLRNFIILYHMFAGFGNNLLGNCNDKDNSPFMYEIDEIDDFRRAINEFDAGNDSMNMEALVNKIKSRVYRKSTPKLRETLERTVLPSGSISQQDIAGVLPHYQAINLENIKTVDSGRFELRRFNAQTSVKELIDELEVIIRLIHAANHKWRIPLEFLDYGEDKF